ncbi:MAG: putative Insecticidal toxin complex protein TccB2 [Geoglossum umbratile]|nr:MAG: putative Insecticidal toxin complex protein TccB2 [Geoglossum umbratile]
MIQLTCENTKTPVPYIDPTLEILENYISPTQDFVPLDLPISAVRALDKQDLTTGPPAELAANPQYVNANAYDLVSKEVYPLDLPFDLWMEAVRTYLAHIEVRRYEIMETFSTADHSQIISDPRVVEEHLGLTASETNIILGVSDSSGTPFTDYWRLFGFAKENLDASTSIPDPADQFHMIQTGDWFSVVTGRVDVFLQQTRITYLELLNCLEIGFVLYSESPLNIVAVEGAPVDTRTLNQLCLVGAGDGSLLNIIRIIWLQCKLDGWSLIDVARAMGSKLLPSDTDSFRNILLLISCIKLISDVLGFCVDQILAFWQPLERTSYRDPVIDDDDLPAPGSQYERIFGNKTISTHGDLTLLKDPSKLAGTLRENLPIITASLNISTSDMNLLLKDPNIVPDDNLNLDNLSSLFRHVTLMQALDLIAKDYLTILQLMAVKPFESPQATVAFIERGQRLGSSPFSLAQVDNLLRSRTRPDEDIRMPDDTLVIVLADIRSKLQQVAIDQAYSGDIDDKKGDITKTRLSLLNWDTNVVATAIGIITNSQSYETALEQPLPSNLILPDSLGEALSYNEDTLILSSLQIMTEDEKTTLNVRTKGLSRAHDEHWNNRLGHRCRINAKELLRR